MHTTILILGTIIFIIAILFLFDKLTTIFFNLIYKSGEKHEGMIYNTKTKKLEADNSDINVL